MRNTSSSEKPGRPAQKWQHGVTLLSKNLISEKKNVAKIVFNLASIGIGGGFLCATNTPQTGF